MAAASRDLTVQLPTSTGVATVSLRIKTAPMRLTELVPLASLLTDIVGDTAIDAAKAEGNAVSCRAGCGACCRQLVSLSIPEVFHIADVIGRLDEQEQANARKRFAEAHERLEEQEMIGRLLEPEIEEGAHPLPVVVDYFRLGMPCPLLVDESCSVHPVRPVRCREYSVTSPAEQCRDPYLHGVDVLPMPSALTVTLARLTAALTDESPRLLPLPLALSWAEQHADLHTRTWAGFELVTRFLGMLAAPPQGDAPRRLKTL